MSLRGLAEAILSVNEIAAGTSSPRNDKYIRHCEPSTLVIASEAKQSYIDVVIARRNRSNLTIAQGSHCERSEAIF